jgi:predicted nuclease with RNAse H fold
MGEVELAQMGIGCFYTGKRSIIKKLIYRGVKLRTSLTQLGFQVIEVYPYATKVLIFGDSLPPKSKPEGLVYLRQHLPKLVPGLEDHVGGLNHKGCDAVLSAYTAYLHINGKTDSLGMPEEGTIAVPSLPK